MTPKHIVIKGVERYSDEDGKFHRTDGPAFINPKMGFRSWWIHGKRHREDGPAIYEAGRVDRWYLYDVQVEPFTPEQLPLLLLKLTEL